MRAVGFHRFGGPEVLEAVELPDPHAGPGEVRIRVRAAAVNPSDLAMRGGAFAGMMEGTPTPHIPGWEVAGVVDEAGDDVRWRVGDEVMTLMPPLGPRGGGYAEQVVVPAESVVRMPAGAGYAEAATLPMNGLAALRTLDLLALPVGGTLAVTGSAGVYGGYVVQLAKVAGLRVVADAAPADEPLVRQLGADVVVPRGDRFADHVREAVPDGVDGLADGAMLGQRVLRAVRDGGAVAVVRPFDGRPERGITVHQVMVTDYLTAQDKLDELRRLTEEGRITLRVADVLPAAEAARAHRRLEAGGVRGRLVLQF
ncbi:MAG TPA: NADP-dependent oxidoreductase [Streptomyces sp.]|uniref:NADP-dependent oxidoreductase n=1 Tax=Streptomyces sp. TaxID=1931 RepID=UPI002D40C203|nr:NADP-dependent oxidoreductase [Streptomyces sp.]HZG06893.1 NADP-dependent oxidoreductase [Streptomyces sp.]